MSPGARSLVVWTGYVIVLGALLLVFPNWFLSIFRIAETDEVWVRIVGMLLVALGPYYWTVARGEFTPMIKASVWVRWAIVVTLVILAYTVGPWQLVLFAAVDFLGGLWTFVASREIGEEVIVKTEPGLRSYEDLVAESERARLALEEFMRENPSAFKGMG